VAWQVLRASVRALVPNLTGLPRSFWVLFAGTLVNRVGGFVLFFLAIYLTEQRGLSATQSGLVISAYGFGAIAGGPTGGALSDRIGRRPTLVASLLGGGASLFMLGLARDAGMITALAVLTGCVYEMYRPVVSATVADIVSPEDRPRAYGLIYWAVNLGAAVAALIGGLIASYSYRALFALDALTTAGFGLVIWAALPETRPALPAHAARPGMRVVLRDSVFLVMCVLAFLFSIVFFQSFVGLPIDMRAHGVSTASYGALMAMNGVLIVLFQPAAGELIRGRSRPSVLALASVLLGIGFGMNGWIGSAPAYAAAIAVWTVGEILFAPASQSLVADFAPAHLRGAYQGAFAVAFTSAFAAAPAAGGFVVARAGAFWLWVCCLIIGLVAAAGFSALRLASPPSAQER